MKRWFTLRMVLILGAILFVLGVVIANWETRQFRETEYATFSSQSIQSATVFARGAVRWLLSDNDAALEFATNIILAGSGQYVRITLHGEVFMDARTDDPDVVALAFPKQEPPSSEDRERSSFRTGGIDVVVPIEIPGQREEIIGFAYLGYSDAHARDQVSKQQLLVFGLAAGSWLIFLLFSVFAVRVVTLKLRLSEVQLDDIHANGIICCGGLRIDTETFDVRLFDLGIEMTPKMFELLAFLAINPGKTYSDADLLSKLWTEAPYAASGDVKQCIYMLRKRLSVACSDPKRIIVNVKGFGYKLEPPTEA